MKEERRKRNAERQRRQYAALSPEERAAENRRKRLANLPAAWARKRRYYARVGGRKPRRWLPDAIARQGGICTWCNLPLPDDLNQIHADHIYPVSRGGETSPENTAALHATCNIQKGARVAA